MVIYEPMTGSVRLITRWRGPKNVVGNLVVSFSGHVLRISTAM